MGKNSKQNFMGSETKLGEVFISPSVIKQLVVRIVRDLPNVALANYRQSPDYLFSDKDVRLIDKNGKQEIRVDLVMNLVPDLPQALKKIQDELSMQLEAMTGRLGNIGLHLVLIDLIFSEEEESR